MVKEAHTNNVTHKDVAGNELAIGDHVFMASSGYNGTKAALVKRVIVGFTAKMIRVERIEDERKSPYGGSLKFPEAVIKFAGPQSASTYEWGVWCNIDDELHRSNMTYEDATGWVQEFADDCPPGNRIKEMYVPVKRTLGEWIKV